MMSHRSIVAGCLLAVFALTGAAWAQSSSKDASGNRLEAARVKAAADSAQATSNAAYATLRKRVEQIDWEDITFEDLVEWLQDQGSVNVVPVWNALGVAGVERESPFSLNLNNTTVAEVLNEAFAALDIDQSGQLRYRAIGNTIRLSTKEDFNRKLYVRVYDVTDILFRVTDFTDAPEIDLEQSQQNSGGGGAGGGSTQPVFSGGGGQGGDDSNRDDENAVEERLEELSTLIQESIEPSFWDDAGGQGRIRFYNKVLVIRASIEIHEEIAGFFSFDE